MSSEARLKDASGIAFEIENSPSRLSLSPGSTDYFSGTSQFRTTIATSSITLVRIPKRLLTNGGPFSPMLWSSSSTGHPKVRAAARLRACMTCCRIRTINRPSTGGASRAQGRKFIIAFSRRMPDLIPYRRSPLFLFDALTTLAPVPRASSANGPSDECPRFVVRVRL